jgi:peptidoglycan hydrolase-like protein with peptidoglycan-binding domain
MTKFHVAAALLAFGSLAALPACSMMDSRTSSAAPMSSPELASGMVRHVQTALQQQGFYTGSIDGIWGPQTRSAVQNFQQAHGLSATGELSSPTLAALNMPASGVAPAMQPAAAAPADTTSSAAPAAPAMAPATPAVAANSNAPAAAPTP